MALERMQAQVHADRGVQDQDVDKRFRIMDKHIAAANSEYLRAAADVKALGQRVSSAEWRIDKVRILHSLGQAGVPKVVALS